MHLSADSACLYEYYKSRRAFSLPELSTDEACSVQVVIIYGRLVFWVTEGWIKPIQFKGPVKQANNCTNSIYSS